MFELNCDFLEIYKRIDHFIKDAYSNEKGISGYIDLMEQRRFTGGWKIESWSKDYEMLKHVRWIRNQLSHEVSFDSDICDQSDYDWLQSFYQRLFFADDPLALLDKKEKEERMRIAKEQKKRQDAIKEKKVKKDKSNSPSVWKKIKAFFSKWLENRE